MGALSKLDEFLLNPQFRTCSVAVRGTSMINDSENREPTGDRSLGDLYPEAMFSTYYSNNLNDSEQEETHHNSSKHTDFPGSSVMGCKGWILHARPFGHRLDLLCLRFDSCESLTRWDWLTMSFDLGVFFSRIVQKRLDNVFKTSNFLSPALDCRCFCALRQHRR